MVEGTNRAEVRNLSKRFGATEALRSVTVGFPSGRITGLVGSNGAGKSTLIKSLAGAVRPDSGSILIDGSPVAIGNPIDARRLGIEVVHQNIDDLVVPGLSVAENLVLDRFAAGNRWLVSGSENRRRAERAAAEIGLDVDLGQPVERCSLSERQMLAIARALASSPRLLILDEPTAALSDVEVRRLFEVLRRIADARSGVAVVFTSHHLQEIEEICSHIVVMRDGEIVLDAPAPVDRLEMVSRMLGSIAELEFVEQDRGSQLIDLENVTAMPGSPRMTLSLSRGEVVGLFGLIGAGKTELMQQFYGLTPLISGSVHIGGERCRLRSPGDAVRSGIVYVPEERGALALIGDWSIAENMALPYLSSYLSYGLLSRRRTEAELGPLVEEMGIKCQGPGDLVSSLSGGNQQKTVVGRWMQRPVRLMLLDEPFRGIDIGARKDIARLLRTRSRESAVVVASSDPEEILEVADRVLVLSRGSLVADRPRAELDSDELLQLAAA